MKRVHIIHDPYKLDESTVADVENPLEYLKSEFKDGFPEHAKIYKGTIAIENDITEKLQKDELLINLIDDDIWVVIFPSEPISAAVWALYALVAVSLATSLYMYLTMPKMQRGDQGSSNNELGQRQNRIRIGGRVPDIYGQVRSYPDLIAESYTYFGLDGVEIERQLLCIGRGYYQINDMKDAMTNIGDIAGTSVSAYDPGTSLTGTPIYKVGRTFEDLPLEVIKSSSITGQTLEAPEDSLLDTNAVYFTNAGEIVRRNTTVNFENLDLSVGDSVILSGAELDFLTETVTSSVTVNPQQQIIFTAPNILDFESYGRIRLGTFNTSIKYWLELTGTEPMLINRSVSFAGEYNIISISRVVSGSNYIYTATISDPENVNSNWLDYVDPTTNNSAKTLNSTITLSDNENDVNLDGTYEVLEITAGKLTIDVSGNTQWQDFGADTQTQDISIILDKLSSKWIGWHTIYQEHAEQAVFNVHFPQGLFRQNSKGGTSEDYTAFQIEWQYVDKDGVPQGNVRTTNRRIDGKTRAAFGHTESIQLMPAYPGIRFRVSRSRKSIANNVSATMNLKTVYLAKTTTKSIYDDVTVIQSEAIGTDGLYQLKERKLNCLVTRKLPLNGTGALTATKSGAQALIHAALDQKNGRRSIGEVDIAQILAEEQAVINYFGNPKAAEFSYTFDDNNLSFEEIAGMVASSMFCEAYRYGNKLRVRFEQPQQNSVLLFNAANKAPNTEKRTKNFGVENKYDGVEIEYTSPDDDTRITYVASDDENSINTMQIKTSGIRSHAQAKTRAWREWNKLKYRNINCEFEALEESELLARNDRILVADNTVIKTKDGIIDYVDGLTLGLSHPIESNVPYFIHLQLADGRVDIVPCSYVDEYAVLLSRPPLIALVPEFTTYQLIESTETPHNAFMVTEIRPQGKMTNMLTCVNYDSRYYAKDQDFF